MRREIAPLVIASDRTIEVAADKIEPVRGDAGAIDRVAINLVQQAIERHGGHVSILGAPGGGAIVRVGFPAG